MSHTKEPWEVTGPNCILAPQIKEGEKNYVLIHCGCCGPVMEEEDMERAVACVNACANLPEPEKNIRELTENAVWATRTLYKNGRDEAADDLDNALMPFKKEAK